MAKPVTKPAPTAKAPAKGGKPGMPAKQPKPSKGSGGKGC